MDFGDDEFDAAFELQASVATMQAEVSQYQKQTQEQLATIRQLQHELSQANLQRQLLQDRLQKQENQQMTAVSTWPSAPSARRSASEFPTSKTSVVGSSQTNESTPPPIPPPPSTAVPQPMATSPTDEHPIGLGTFLCRTVFQTSTLSGGTAPCFLQKVVLQKLDTEQDASLLSFLLEHTQAYATARRNTGTTITTFLGSTSPLPWLWHALVFCQARLLPTSETSRKRPFRCRTDNQAPEVKQAWEQAWHTKRPTPLNISSVLLEHTMQSLLSYGEELLRMSTGGKGEYHERDILYVCRLLVLPPSQTVKMGSDFVVLLWEWVGQHLAAHIEAEPTAPRRIVDVHQGRRLPLEILIAAFCLGRSRCHGNTAESTPPPSWMRYIVGITGDWIHFSLLPCFRIYRQPEKESNKKGLDNDGKASLACEIIQTWQSWGLDNDWIRTQLRTPRSDESLGSSIGSSPSTVVNTTITHASSVLQLSCRLLQAIALEEDPDLRAACKSLKDCLLCFLGPLVTKHPNWLDTSSQLDYTSALAHLKANSRDDLAQACWESAREDPSMVC